MNIQGWMVWSPWVQGTLKNLPSITIPKNLFFSVHDFFMFQFSYLYSMTGKTIALTIWTFDSKVMSQLFSMLSRFVITILPRSKGLLISWQQSPSTVILEPKKIKSVIASTFLPSICHEVMGLDVMNSIFWMLNLKPAFSLSSFTFIKRLFISSSLSAIRMVSSAYLRFLIFLPTILIPACDSSSLEFYMIYFVYKLSNQVTIYSFVFLLSQFSTSLLFHFQL